MTIYSFPDYDREPTLAKGELGRLLRLGAIRLFLGAGASMGFGLPSWQLLIARVLQQDTNSDFMSTLPTKEPESLCRMVDAVDDGSETYARKVHEALYRDVPADLVAQFAQSPLLLAAAALVTGTDRGRVDSIVTYNYDDLLERYLRMLGFSSCVRSTPSDLTTRAHVEIGYVHGRLAYTGQDFGRLDIVLSEKSYRARRSEIQEGWAAIVVHGLCSKIGLFIGLSGNDQSMLDVMERAKNRVARGQNYNGYWILTPNAYEQNKDRILSVGMCPLRFSKEEIPRFLFSVCEQAAMNHS